MAKSSLSPHEPEALSTVPLLLKASKIFRNHTRVLLTAAFTLTAIPLISSFLVIAFGPDSPEGQAQPGRGTLPRPPKGPSSTVVFLLLVTVLMSAIATVALVAIVVHVVVGDHLGRTPGSLQLAVRRSFCRLASTLLAKMGVMMGLLMAINLIGGFVIVLLVVSVSKPSPYAILVAYVLLLLIATPIVILVSMSLSLAEHASVIEGPGVWGFAALRRSWALSKGVWSTLLMTSCVGFVVALVLAGSLDLLAANMLRQSGFAVAASLVAALLLGALLICQGVYFKVAWCLLYLSARKKAEPEFGLTNLQQYFEADPSNPGTYALMGLPTEEV